MTPPDEPRPDDGRATRLRWIGRAVVAAIGLWFLAEGISGVWGGAGLAVLAAVVVALAVVALVLTRRRG